MNYFYSVFFSLCIFFCSVPSAYSLENQIKPSYLVGGNFIYSLRTGSYHFSHLKMKQDTIKENLLLGGFSIGKRYHIIPWFRMQFSGSFHGGTIKEGIPSVENNFKHVGIDLDAHLVKNISPLSNYFIVLGGGINRMYLAVKALSYKTNIKNSSASVNSGMGFEYTVNNDVHLSFSYIFRFWRPIHYKERLDLIIEPISYDETFLSHIFKLDILFTLFKE